MSPENSCEPKKLDLDEDLDEERRKIVFDSFSDLCEKYEALRKEFTAETTNGFRNDRAIEFYGQLNRLVDFALTRIAISGLFDPEEFPSPEVGKPRKIKKPGQQVDYLKKLWLAKIEIAEALKAKVGLNKKEAGVSLAQAKALLKLLGLFRPRSLLS